MYLRCLNGLEDDNNSPSNTYSKYVHRGTEMDPQNGRSSRDRETASIILFALYVTDPPRLVANRR